jgi:hypothetical protein
MGRRSTDRSSSLSAGGLEQLRVLAVAGIGVGVLVVGFGSRLAMLALRLTSPNNVIGIQSDDDFTIGRFTLGGTYNLLMLGGAVGIIGVAVYQCVSPRLVGPHWFRRLTIALAAGAVGGSLLVHSDGIDFRLLKPTWFAIGLFVLLPALFAVAIGAAVDRVSRPSSITARGRTRWALPVGLALAFPFTIVLLAVAAVVFPSWVVVRSSTPLARVASSRVGNVVIQAGWLAVAVLGFTALVSDVNALI